MTLVAADLLAEAAALTGRDDFGNPQFLRGFETLTASINNEAALTEAGMAAQRQRILGLLANRLRVQQAFAEHPEILDEPIEAPILIVGLPRTGSTMTHRLLASDPAHTAMRWWEGRHPAMLPGERRGEPSARRALGRAEVEAVVAASPRAMDIHPWDFEGADEEVLLIEHSFHSSVPEAHMHLPSYARWVEAQDHGPVYRDLRAMLQYLQWQTPGRAGKRWVLKTPHHLGYMDALLAAFPDAKIVQTHRDPRQTVPSLCSMCADLAAPLTRTPNPQAIGAHWMRKLSRNLNACMEVAAARPDRFLDLHFRELVQDPIAQMARIYEFAGERFGDRAEAAMRAYRQDDAHQASAHTYKLEDYGLSEAQIDALFGAYIKRYQLRPSIEPGSRLT